MNPALTGRSDNLRKGFSDVFSGQLVNMKSPISMYTSAHPGPLPVERENPSPSLVRVVKLNDYQVFSSNGRWAATVPSPSGGGLG